MRACLLLAAFLALVSCSECDCEDVPMVDWTGVAPSEHSLAIDKAVLATTSFSVAGAISGVDADDFDVVWYRAVDGQAYCEGTGLDYEMGPICLDIQAVREALEVEVWAHIVPLEDGETAKCQSKNFGEIPGPTGHWVNWYIDLEGVCP